MTYNCIIENITISVHKIKKQCLYILIIIFNNIKLFAIYVYIALYRLRIKFTHIGIEHIYFITICIILQ